MAHNIENFTNRRTLSRPAQGNPDTTVHVDVPDAPGYGQLAEVHGKPTDPGATRDGNSPLPPIKSGGVRS